MFHVDVGQTILHPCGPKTTVEWPISKPRKPPALRHRLFDICTPCFVPVELNGAFPGGHVPVHRGPHVSDNQRVLHGCTVLVGLGGVEVCHHM
jgi:hypothetical protein